jgi:PPOX class probable F420-dependent enzyme
VSRRTAIAMSAEEAGAFLEEERTLICATVGRDGWPHLMPLWFVVRDGVPWAWTYAKSQKVRNLERDPRCTVQVEAGDAYGELRGLMGKGEAVIHRGLEAVAAVGAELAVRYGEGALGPELQAAMRAQAAKRVALEFVLRELSTWDHRKLAGAY